MIKRIIDILTPDKPRHGYECTEMGDVDPENPPKGGTAVK